MVDISIYQGHSRVTYFAESKLGQHWILSNRQKEEWLDNGKAFTSNKDVMEELMETMKKDDLIVEITQRRIEIGKS